ncbi:MAG: cbb3-type cytochrome oxidase assembly protein CcoS [Puniceicoccaceae bacterium]|nr:MAG: cbb3-type cytochrome oxidase assembly protein CcoS [Puniceicoccaceae bacterium]
MEWLFYLIAFIVALCITFTGAWALRWAVRQGQLSNLEEQSRSIFTEEEPEGRQSDFFPGRGGSSRRSRRQR